MVGGLLIDYGLMVYNVFCFDEFFEIVTNKKGRGFFLPLPLFIFVLLRDKKTKPDTNNRFLNLNNNR